VDGGNKRLITTYHTGGYPDYFYAPEWSPSGQDLTYTDCLSAGCTIRVVRPASGGKLTPDLGANWTVAPTWSPDGRELAFVSSETGVPVAGMGISAASLSTRKFRTITPPKRYRWDASPDWSPDGKTIAFTRQVVGQPPVVYLVGQDGRNLKWLTRGESPSWSPNGRSLVFGLGNGIYRINADGGARTLLARVPGVKHLDPRWSPDGYKILYTTASPPAIWTMNTDGTDKKRIVVIRGPGDHNSNVNGAAWRPG
jgi:Tol biopolymer transport system component